MMLSLLADLTMLLGLLVIIGIIVIVIASIIVGSVVNVSRLSSITPYILRFKCTCGHSYLYDTRHGDDDPRCDSCFKSFGLTRKEHA